MKTKESIEIPLGAKDSELKGWEYTIPEGMEAEIKDGKIIVREKESEDERIRQDIITTLSIEVSCEESALHPGAHTTLKEAISWLKKQNSQNLANSAKTCKVEQKPAWSEEDDEWINYFEQLLEFVYNNDAHNLGKSCFAGKMWLKALKERCTWKPSDEQMEYLAKAITTLGNEGDNKKSAILCELRTDLNKLTE